MRRIFFLLDFVRNCKWKTGKVVVLVLSNFSRRGPFDIFFRQFRRFWTILDGDLRGLAGDIYEGLFRI